MKPRIRFEGGLWVCRYPGTWTGWGYKPKEAYDEWLLMELPRTSEAAGSETT